MTITTDRIVEIANQSISDELAAVDAAIDRGRKQLDALRSRRSILSNPKAKFDVSSVKRNKTLLYHAIRRATMIYPVNSMWQMSEDVVSPKCSFAESAEMVALLDQAGQEAIIENDKTYDELVYILRILNGNDGE